MIRESKRFSKRHWYGLLFLMIVLAVIAISQGNPQEETLPEPQTVSGIDPEFGMVFHADGSIRPIVQRTYSGLLDGLIVQQLPVSVVESEDAYVYQGDILLNFRHTEAGLGVSSHTYLWDGDLVAYQIDPKLPDQQRIHDAIAHWEANTSIRFVERTNANAGQYPDYILFRPGLGCSSYVGRQGGMQPINLALQCSTGNTIHEIGHAIGLWHEQSRSDRDEYVEVRYENIISMYAFNFDKQLDNGQDLGEYDYGSIMHYPRWAFSKNGQDTIIPRGNQEIGQRDGLSPGDIAAVQAMYD